MPKIDGNWGSCDPQNPKNQRSRCSILIQKWSGEMGTNAQATTVLIDTSPDLRSQLLRTGIKHLDAILFTHDHADQSHGIDDVRHIAYRMRAQIPTYMDAQTCEILTHRFDYCFTQKPGSLYPAILKLKMLPLAGKALILSGPGSEIAITPFTVGHGPIDALGFAFDAFLYSPDVKTIPAESWQVIDQGKIWICDCLQLQPHPSHAHLEETLAWFQRAKVKQGILTNMHIHLDYNWLTQNTPDHIGPAHDGFSLSNG